jgi:hypothetical protein
MLLHILKDEEIILQFRCLKAESRCGVGHARVIVFAFFAQDFAGLGDLVEVVEVLDELLEADGDEQAYDNGCDVDEEVAPCAGSVVGGVYVEHASGFLGR